jgi:hypothetical protein
MKNVGQRTCLWQCVTSLLSLMHVLELHVHSIYRSLNYL